MCRPPGNAVNSNHGLSRCGVGKRHFSCYIANRIDARNVCCHDIIDCDKSALERYIKLFQTDPKNATVKSLTDFVAY